MLEGKIPKVLRRKDETLVCRESKELTDTLIPALQTLVN